MDIFVFFVDEFCFVVIGMIYVFDYFFRVYMFVFFNLYGVFGSFFVDFILEISQEGIFFDVFFCLVGQEIICDFNDC